MDTAYLADERLTQIDALISMRTGIGYHVAYFDPTGARPAYTSRHEETLAVNAKRRAAGRLPLLCRCDGTQCVNQLDIYLRSIRHASTPDKTLDQVFAEARARKAPPLKSEAAYLAEAIREIDELLRITE